MRYVFRTVKSVDPTAYPVFSDRAFKSLPVKSWKPGELLPLGPEFDVSYRIDAGGELPLSYVVMIRCTPIWEWRRSLIGFRSAVRSFGNLSWADFAVFYKVADQFDQYVLRNRVAVNDVLFSGSFVHLQLLAAR